jgi:hypothetical protein
MTILKPRVPKMESLRYHSHVLWILSNNLNTFITFDIVLTQVRPSLKIVNLSFPAYQIVGSAIALDEASVSSRSLCGFE